MKVGRVLVVDDHQDTRTMLAETFRRRMNCEAIVASSVDEAESLLKLHSFHVIVSDFDMPKRNGAELAKILSRLPCEAPLLFYTGLQQPSEFWLKLDYPCHAILKPNLDDLLAIAANFLNG